jgi:hypothetical protein
VSAKRKRTDEPEDIEISPPLRIKDMTFNVAIFAGHEYGGYVKHCIGYAKIPVDFATFVNALPRDFGRGLKSYIFTPKIRATEGMGHIFNSTFQTRKR